MSQTVWIARHGNRIDFVNPDWFNTATRRYDPHLSDDGLLQARKLGQRLKQENIKHIFASPFLRTIQTANEVAKILDLAIEIEAGFGEWHNPEWMSELPETHPPEWLKAEFPRLDWNHQSLIVPQYPETEAEVNQRTAETARRLVAKYSEDLLIVGHGASVWGATQGLIPGYPIFEVALCCLVKIVRNGDKWQLELCGDTSHLG